MRWIGSPLQTKNRRLELSVGGRWFLLFTLVLGIVAVRSGNNVIYLLESLLLSSLLFSGVLSELNLSRVRLSRELRQAVAGEAAPDQWCLENLGHLPLYCLEVGEWRGQEFHSLQFLLVLPGKAKIRLRSRQILPSRGRHSWDGLAVATSFPFGFARKIRFLLEPNSRIVWPAGAGRARADAEMDRQGSWEPVLGELSEAPDYSRVHWPSTLRAGRPLERPRRPESNERLVRLRLPAPGPEREQKIAEAAAQLFAGGAALLLEDGSASSRVEGSWPGLDVLALLPKEAP